MVDLEFSDILMAECYGGFLAFIAKLELLNRERLIWIRSRLSDNQLNNPLDPHDHARNALIEAAMDYLNSTLELDSNG